ncbi:MAG: BolA family protein [Pseudomonadota bacterium]|jgi:BolA protein
MKRLEEMRRRLASLAPQYLEIGDDSAQHAGHASAQGGGHYSLHIVSRQFAGLGVAQRHRMVYCALGEMMQREIHALSIKAETP